MTTRWTVFLLSGLLLSSLLAGATGASASDKTDVVRDLAGRVGPVIGSALACQDIARPRIQVIIDKFATVITAASSNEAERSDLVQLLDRTVADGRATVTSGQMDCRSADRQLADLERSIVRTALPPAIAPGSVAAIGTSPTAAVPVVAPHGVTDREIRFGISAAF